MAGTVARRVGKIIALLVALVVAIGAAVAYIHREDINDYFLASSFEPSPRVAEIQRELAFTPAGDRVFLASQPTLSDREKFAVWCAKVDHSEGGHVLGCYAERRIHLFDVTDERLDGIVEVTAAHELLHATFARMKPSERDELSKRLVEVYEELSQDSPELAERMSVYEQLSDASFANELHSVLGTEVSDLPDWLEEHYAQWFNDRAMIVEWYNSYHSVFTELTTEAERLGAELDSLRADIESRSAAYDEAVRQFNDDAADFRERNENYEFSGNRELFEQIRDSLLTRQHELETTLKGIQDDTDHFNELREQLIALNDISVELNEVLDSNLPTPTTEPESDH